MYICIFFFSQQLKWVKSCYYSREVRDTQVTVARKLPGAEQELLQTMQYLMKGEPPPL